MIKQRKINKELGRDIHVRDFSQNRYQETNKGINEILLGEILLPESEPILSANGTVTVKLARGGEISGVAYPNAFKEPITGNIHGLYEGPFTGQMVGISFADGNAAMPMVVNRYPYQGAGNTATEFFYKNPLTFAGYNAQDVILGHITGSYLSFNTGFPVPGELPGSVTLSALTEIEITALMGITIDSLVAVEMSSLAGASVKADVLGSASISSLLGAIVKADVTGLVEISSLTQSMGQLIINMYGIIAAIDLKAGSAQASLIATELLKWALLLKT